MRSDSHKKENQVTTLFVNACMRGEASRTLALCREYLERFDDVVEVDVAALDLKPSTPIVGRTVRRSRGQGSGTIPFSAYRASSRKPTTSSSVCRTGIFRFRLRLKRTLNMSACAS